MADIASVGSLLGVSFLVVGQIRRMSERFVARIATERLHARVNPFVNVQLGFLSERLRARVAFERFLPRVHPLVHDQRAGQGKRLFAQLTFERFFAGVRSSVFYQFMSGRIGERLMTHVAVQPSTFGPFNGRDNVGIDRRRVRSVYRVSPFFGLHDERYRLFTFITEYIFGDTRIRFTLEPVTPAVTEISDQRCWWDTGVP